MKYLCLIVLIVVMLSGLCFAARYELSDDQQKYILNLMARSQIQGAEAPMFLQTAQALQRPVIEKVEKEKPQPAAEPVKK